MNDEDLKAFLAGVDFYDPPAPRQLPPLVWSLIDQLTNPHEYMALVGNLAVGKGTVNPYPREPHRGAVEMLADEHRRLSTAQLFYVPDDMTQLAHRASRGLPAWGLRPGDLPSTSGFVLYERPIGGYVSALSGERIPIVAMSWGPTRFATSADSNVWVTFWSATNYEFLSKQILAAAPQLGVKMNHLQARQQAYAQTAELQWDNEAILTLTDDPQERLVVKENPLGVWQNVDIDKADMAGSISMPWLNVLRSTWLLMKQAKHVTMSEEPLPRNLRRQAERRAAEGGSVNASSVRVVNMNRRNSTRASGSGATGTGHPHKVRYPTTGHWRDQPYPSEGTTRKIYIDEFWCGPENAPVRYGKNYRVNVLNRPGR